MIELGKRQKEKTGRSLTLTLGYDQDAENPATVWDGQWTPYSFGRKHYNFRHPDEFGIRRDGSTTNLGLRNKMRVGLAFILGYYEHGQCEWFLKGEGSPGTNCRFDGVSVAGVLIWEYSPDDMGAKTYEKRAEDARAFLKTYTNWCNGNVYGFSLEDEEGEIDSCWGFYDAEGLFDAIRESIEKDDEIEITGEAAWLANYHDLKGR